MFNQPRDMYPQAGICCRPLNYVFVCGRKRRAVTYPAFLKGLGTKRQAGCWSGFKLGAVGHCIQQLCVCLCVYVYTRLCRTPIVQCPRISFCGRSVREARPANRLFSQPPQEESIRETRLCCGLRTVLLKACFTNLFRALGKPADFQAPP